MSLRRVDPRFCLPEPPRTALVLGGLDAWVEGLSQAGVDVRGEGPVDLVVAPEGAAPEALAAGGKTIILEGRGGARRLRELGLSVRSFLVRPRADAPEVLLPRDDPLPAVYAIRQWSAGYTRSKRLRNTLAAMLVARRALPEIDPVIAVGTTVGTRSPWVVTAAEPLGVPADVRWFMSCGQGDALSRNVFHLFRPGAADPSWALKFARVPGYDDPFRRDEAGLGLAERAGGVVRERAPRLVGRFSADGTEASLETAAVGEKLRAALLAPGGAERKLRLVQDVADWLLAMALETAAPPPAIRAELDRLLHRVVPAWASAGISPSLVTDLPPLPAVLQHNDMGCWNIVSGRSGFTVVDWESACEHGLPLWDLVYFLTDAFATLDRAFSPQEQDEHSRRLLRGESPRSRLLFASVERAACELEIPRDAVGPIVTLGWLHHGLSQRARAEVVDGMGGGEPGLPAPASRLAPSWLEDPALGIAWRAWNGA